MHLGSAAAEQARAPDTRFRHGPCLVPRLNLRCGIERAGWPRGKGRAEPARFAVGTRVQVTRKPLGRQT